MEQLYVKAVERCEEGVISFCCQVKVLSRFVARCYGERYPHAADRIREMDREKPAAYIPPTARYRMVVPSWC